MRKKQPKSWFKARGYNHLTNKISGKDESKITSYVSNERKVAKHAFFPLLHKKISQRRFKTYEDKNDILKKGHKKLEGDQIVSNKKIRPIFYATHIDTQVYAYYSNEIIQKKYEEYLSNHPKLSECITAYRRIPVNPNKEEEGNKSSIHFAKDVFEHIKIRGECVAMAYDIKSFFTNLDHKILKKAWVNLLGTKTLPKDHYNIFKSITNFSYVNLDDLRVGKGFDEKKISENRKKGVQAFFQSPTELRGAIKRGELRVFKNQYHNELEGSKRSLRGIPQGLPISAMLANLYMLNFDKAVYQKVAIEHNGFYRRYSDDIVVVCDEKDRKELQKFLIEEIQKYKLKIAVAKTEICIFRYINSADKQILKSHRLIDDKEKYNISFNYLGFEFYGDKTLIKSANLAKFYRRMKKAVKTKAKRIEKLKDQELIDEAYLYKRQLYRIYSYLGQKTKKWKIKRQKIEYDEEFGHYIFSEYERNNFYRGNYLHYAKRASKIMNEPAIERQLRNHFKILEDYIKKHIDALNVS